MQQATVIAAFLLLVIICCAQSSPYTGDRDFDVPFRKKPLRRDHFELDEDVPPLNAYWRFPIACQPPIESPSDTESRTISFSETQTPKLKRKFRGCSAFGHSCFGGHGKRSDSSMMGPQMKLEQRLPLQQRLPNSDLFRQWLQAYRGSGSMLDGQ